MPITRRKVLKVAASSVALGAVGGVVYVGKQRIEQSAWEGLVGAESHVDTLSGSVDGDLREIVRCATMAANSHNTQPWRFLVGKGRIEIRPDFSRRLAAVDPDDHHLFVSLGCAAENVVQAAPAFGYHAECEVREGAVSLTLAPAHKVAHDLFPAILRRQCTRAPFDGRPTPSDGMRALEAAGTGSGVRVHLFESKTDLERLLGYLVQANSIQMRDQAFRNELKRWIRFNYGEAMATRDGLFSLCTGNPNVPGWLGRGLFDRVYKVDDENAKYVRQVRSSSGIAVFVSEKDDAPHWVEAGRSYQRFALRATALGLRHSFVNPPVEVPKVRSELADFLGASGRVDLLVRFGFGAEMPKSLRRPLDEVIERA